MVTHQVVYKTPKVSNTDRHFATSSARLAILKFIELVLIFLRHSIFHLFSSCSFQALVNGGTFSTADGLLADVNQP